MVSQTIWNLWRFKKQVYWELYITFLYLLRKHTSSDVSVSKCNSKLHCIVQSQSRNSSMSKSAEDFTGTVLGNPIITAEVTRPLQQMKFNTILRAGWRIKLHLPTFNSDKKKWQNCTSLEQGICAGLWRETMTNRCTFLKPGILKLTLHSQLKDKFDMLNNLKASLWFYGHSIRFLIYAIWWPSRNFLPQTDLDWTQNIEANIF